MAALVLLSIPTKLTALFAAQTGLATNPAPPVQAAKPILFVPAAPATMPIPKAAMWQTAFLAATAIPAPILIPAMAQVLVQSLLIIR